MPLAGRIEDFMRHKIFLSTATIFIASSFYLAMGVSAQTPDTPSIADVARQSREQKKATPKTATVITNDTLKPAPSQPVSAAPAAVVAPSTSSPATDGNSSNAASNTASAQPELSAEDSEKLKVEIAALKLQFKDKQNDVDLLQRLLKLDQDAVQSKPDSARDVDGQAKLEAELTELTQRRGELEALKTKLQSLTAEDPTKPEAPPKP
jgi:hypothetical protein